MPTREEAFALLKAYNGAALTTHGLAVEGTMRYFARKAGEDEEKWGIVGLLHDLDYEKYPDLHCTKTAQKLQKLCVKRVTVKRLYALLSRMGGVSARMLSH